MASHIKERLLQVGQREEGSRDRASNDREEGLCQRRPSGERLGPATEDVAERWSKHGDQQGGGKQADPALTRKFLRRLAVALHTYGNSAPRTEYLVEKASKRLGVNTSIAVFPSLILLSFMPPDNNASNAETHVLDASQDLDVNKLGRADELASRVGKEHLPLLVAYWRLRAIATSPPQFGPTFKTASYALLAATGSLLFFNGSLTDAFFSLFLGLCVGLLDLFSAQSDLMASITMFLAALVVSFLSAVVDLYVRPWGACYMAMALGSIIWLLPGMSLTIAVTELAAGSQVSGTSRFMSALLDTLQLGFGLAVGQQLVFWDKQHPTEKCPSTDLSPWLNLVWFLGFAGASNILLNARWDQWPGLTLTSAVGYLVSYFAGMRLETYTATVLAAFAIGITSALYSRFSGQLPITLTLSGILLLVPGGIGVQGAQAMAQKDAMAGVGLTVDMVVVSLSITIGLLVARLAFPSGLFGKGVKQATTARQSLAAELEEDNDNDVGQGEDMPI